MLAQLLLLFSVTKLALADNLHEYYGCIDDEKRADCETSDAIKITGTNGWKYYCNCNSANRHYQVSFDFTSAFTIPSQFFVSSRISSISIPKLCTGISEGAFYGSTIDTITFDADARPSISHDAFGDVTFTGALTLPEYAQIENSAFYFATFQASLTLPNKLTTITDYTFQLATFQSNLIFPDDLKIINGYAFYDAKFKEDVSLKSKVTQIYENAFRFSTFEKTLSFGNAETVINQFAFINTTFIGLVTLPAKLSMISYNSFESATFHTALTLPNKVKTISSSAFIYAKFLRTLTLPASVEKILGSAFKEAQIQSAINFQNTKTTISSNAFEGTVFGQTVALPTQMTKIESNTFTRAVFQHSITFPSNLNEIGSSAFKDAKFTDAITLPASLVSIRLSAFNGCVFSLDTSLEFGRYTRYIEKNAFQNSNLQSMSFNENAQLASIGQSAFEGLFQLKIAGEKKLLYSETISQSAFEGDENIDFNSITSKYINKYAFRNCFNLVVANEILILYNGNVLESAFQNCHKLNGALTMQGKATYTDLENYKSSIGKYAFQGTNLKYLNLPYIVSINDYAFENCVSLEGPSNSTYEELNVDTISQYAFSGDVKLHFKTIKSKSIGSHSFEFCRNLGADILLTDGGNVADYSFYSCDKLGSLTYDLSHLNDYQLVTKSDSITIPTYAFAKSGLSGKLVIPRTVEKISKYAFSNCNNISSIEIDRQYTLPLEIEDYAFCNSQIGSELLIPRFVTVVGKYSFAKTPISKLTVEGTKYREPISRTRDGDGDNDDLITDIQSCAFADCTNLETVIFGNETIQIDDDTFKGCHFKSMTLGNVNKIPDDAFIGMTEMDGNFDIPDSVEEIGNRAFSECYNIKKITINPNSMLNSIGKSAFYKCRGLESIVIPSKVTTIDSYAFYQCTGLKTITILSHVAGDNGKITINDYAFYGCTSLTGTLTLPEGLRSIGEGAFQGCGALRGTLTFPNSLTEIKERAFMGCKTLTGGLRFGVKVGTIGKYAFRGCSNLDGKLNFVDCYDGTDTNKLYLNEGAFYGCSKLTGDLNIPLRCQLAKEIIIGTDQNGNDIKRYEPSPNVFKGCSELNGQLIIPDEITSIPAGTFCDCSKLNGEIKSNLELIGNEAFRNCVKLTGSIDLTSYKYNNYIGSYAFCNCTGLNGQLIFSDLSDVEFIKVGEYAFYNCAGLTGELNCTSFNYIQRYAFAGCTGLKGPLNFGLYLLKVGAHAFEGCTGFSGTLSFRSVLDNELSIEESAFKGCSGFKDGTLLFVMDRSNMNMNPSSTYYLKIEQNAFEDTKFKDVRYIGRTQPDCDCDIGLPSRKGIHTSSNYEGKKFCGNPLHKSKLSGGAIAGIVIACIVVVAVIIFLIVFFLLKNKKNRDNSENEVEMNHDP